MEITESSSPTTGRKKRTIKETKTSSLDAGDGTKRTVTETKTETIEPQEGEEPADKAEEKSWKPIDERNLFDKYKFIFGSIGTFGSGKKTNNRETLKFRDFDDLVDKFKNLHQKSKADIQKEELENEREVQKTDTEKKAEEPEKETAGEEEKVKDNQKVEKDEKNKQIKDEQAAEVEQKGEEDETTENKDEETEKPAETEEPCGELSNLATEQKPQRKN